MNKVLKLSFVAALGVATLASCGDDNEPTPGGGGEEMSLYTRLGEKANIEAATDDFLVNVLADIQIKDDFEATVANGRATDLRNNLVDQICEATGGPCTYTGLSMVEAHENINVNDADFTALVTDLSTALDGVGAAPADRDELLTALGMLKGDIVIENSLFDALGGTATIEAVVDKFLENVLADDRINERFNTLSGAAVSALRQNLIDQVSDICGGGQYTGLSMAEAHENMNITKAEFDALVEDLVAAVNSFGLDEATLTRINNELYTPLLDLESSIVGK